MTPEIPDMRRAAEAFQAEAARMDRLIDQLAADCQELRHHNNGLEAIVCRGAAEEERR